MFIFLLHATFSGLYFGIREATRNRALSVDLAFNLQKNSSRFSSWQTPQEVPGGRGD